MRESERSSLLLQTLVSVASACAVVSVYAYLTSAPNPAPARSPETVHMDRKIARIHLRQASLEEALKGIADAARVDIVADSNSNVLKTAQQSLRFDIVLNDVSLRSALESIAWRLNLDLEWRVESDHVLVTDRNRFASAMSNVLRAYEVNYLLARGESFAALFPPPFWSYDPQIAPDGYSPRAAAIESLVNLTLIVGDDPWSSFGKPPGQVLYGLNRLLVLAPADGHTRIRALLDQIRHGGEPE